MLLVNTDQWEGSVSPGGPETQADAESPRLGLPSSLRQQKGSRVNCAEMLRASAHSETSILLICYLPEQHDHS